MRTVTMPVDLIVGLIIHRAYAELMSEPRRPDPFATTDEERERVARALLREIAGSADMTTVLHCIAEAGAPAGLDMIGAALENVADAQRAPPKVPALPPAMPVRNMPPSKPAEEV